MISTSDAFRFWSRVALAVPSACWLWTGRPVAGGYGAIRINGATTLVHRVSWQIEHGTDPGDMCVCHRCDVRLCVNPEHLFLGTYADNNHDMMTKGRFVPLRGNANGRAKLSPEKVQVIRFLRASTSLSLVDVGALFGVCARAVFDISRRAKWPHVPNLNLDAARGGGR